MTESDSTGRHLPNRKVFEANFPMSNHMCDDREYRLESKENTDREVGGKTVVKYVFALVEEDETGGVDLLE